MDQSSFKIVSPKMAFFLLIIMSATNVARSQDKKENPFSVALNLGLTQSRIKSFESGEIKDVNLPDDHQKFTVGSYYGAAANYLYKKKFMASLGCTYLINRIHYTLPELRYTLSDSVSINANGDIKNSTHSLYVPLTISYLLSEKPNSIFVAGGVALNFYLGTRKKFVVKSDVDQSELRAGDSKYKIEDYNKINLCFPIGAGYNYRFSEKLNIRASLLYNFTKGRILQEELVLNANHRMNFWQLGINFNYNL